MRSKGVKAVVIGVVIALLGISPAHGQSGPESDPLAPEAGDMELPLPPDPQGEDLSDCHELYAQGEWNEGEYGELLECLFELSDLRRPESSSQMKLVTFRELLQTVGMLV